MPSILIASALVIGLFMAALITLPSSEGNPPTPNVPARAAAYSVHATILIDGNAGFLGPNATTGISWGSGDIDDPYIIEGWDINASAANGIQIQNTNAYFIIRGCYIHNGSSSYVGIYLLSCLNGTLRSNTWSNNFAGIYLAFSSSNTIFDNTCSLSSQEGIYLGISSNNTVSGNNCSDNWYGIVIWSSNNNTVSNNTCSSNTNNEGIYLGISSNNTLRNNTCSNNGGGIYLGSSSDNNTLSGNNCSSNNWYGIDIWSSNNNTLSGNNCSSNNGDGIYLYSSSNNVLSRNQFCNNVAHGGYIDSGSNNVIWNNAFIGNNGAGSIYDPSHIQAYDDGMNNWWNTSGSPHGYGNYWGDLTTPDNNVDGIVDWSYNLTGSAGAKDYYPLTTHGLPIPEPSILILAGVIMGVFLMVNRTRHPDRHGDDHHDRQRPEEPLL